MLLQTKTKFPETMKTTEDLELILDVPFNEELVQKVSEELLEGINEQDEPEEEAIAFINHRVPLVKSGIFHLSAQQDIHLPDGKTETFRLAEKKLVVAGPRFAISTENIHSAYPAAGSCADYTSAFPHISFKRATLPWEVRMSLREKSWLALVLFHEEDPLTVEEMRLGDFVPALEELYDANQLIRVVHVPVELQPVSNDLQCHVRQLITGKQSPEETAWVVANRFPKAGKNTVHLISLADSSGENRFLSVYSWQFECKKERGGFKEAVQNLHAAPFQLTPGENHNRIYERGLVPLPHFLKQGQKTLSLYQSPLAPYFPGRLLLQSGKMPAYSYRRVEWEKLDTDSVMANVSYAAAFYLGQMLTIANKQVSQAIFRWKRQFYQLRKKAFLEEETGKKAPEILDEMNETVLREPVLEWVSDFLSLKKIPFNYLVPYPEMLPEHSIRYFKIHERWMKNCLDGVFSIGEEYFRFDPANMLYQGDYTGVLIRDVFIGHYPELVVKAFGKNHQTGEETVLQSFFSRKLGTEILMCCFKGSIEHVEISLPPRIMHLGAELINGRYLVAKRTTGSEEQAVIDISEIINHKGIVDFSKLKEMLGCKSAAQLAVHLTSIG